MEPRARRRNNTGLQRNGIAFVAYSQLGRGFLTGQIKKFEDFAEENYRRMSPRFKGENFDKNLTLFRKDKTSR